VLAELEEHGWYNSEKGELVCGAQDEIEFIVHDFIEGFDEDLPGAREKLVDVIGKYHELHAPEVMFIVVFETLRRMVA